jgi:hypothetical protein
MRASKKMNKENEGVKKEIVEKKAATAAVARVKTLGPHDLQTTLSEKKKPAPHCDTTCPRPNRLIGRIFLGSKNILFSFHLFRLL